MSENLGPRTYGEKSEGFMGRAFGDARDYSEKIAERIDDEINTLLANAKETARTVIRQQRTHMDAIVKHLLEKETIEKEEFIALIGPAVKAETLVPLPATM